MILIDGLNLLYKHPRYKSQQDLIFAISKYCKKYNKKCIIIFDGVWDYEGEYDTNFVKVEYVENADERIKDLILKNQRSQVISSDREVQRFAKSHNSKPVKSENFDFRIVDDDHEKSPFVYVSDKEIKEYINAMKK